MSREGAGSVEPCPAIMVRAARPGDLPVLTDLYNHYVLTSHVTFDLAPVTLEDRRAWYEHYAPTGRHRLLVAEEAGGRLAGYATSSRFRPKPAYDTSVETSVYVAPDLAGRGIGGLLYRTLFAILDGEDVHRAFAGVALPNPASVALHRRFGFREIGTFDEAGRKFDRWWSVAWFAKSLPG